MRISFRSYPHPVLSYFSDDLIQCAFQATVKVETASTLYRVKVGAELSSRDLRQLIALGKAAYALHVECSATRYRRIATSSESAFTLDIPTSAVQGVVDLCVLVVATQPIREYRNANFHPDYGHRAFAVGKGDVLAVAEDRTFIAESTYDQLRRIPSIFEIVRAPDGDAPPMELDLTGNKIIVLLRSADYDTYAALVPAAHLQPIIASIIAVPVLVEVLEAIKSADDADHEFGNCRWYQLLRRKLVEEGVIYPFSDFPSSTVGLVQKLLEAPVTGALSTVQAIAEEE